MKKIIILTLALICVILLSKNALAVVASSEIKVKADLAIDSVSSTHGGACISLDTETLSGVELKTTRLCFNMNDPGYVNDMISAFLYDDLKLYIDGTLYSTEKIMAYANYNGGDIDSIIALSTTKMFVVMVANDDSYFTGVIELDLDDDDFFYDLGVVHVDGVLIGYTEERISTLESWSQGIDSLIIGIQNEIATLKSWLFFTGHTDLCDAATSQCGGVGVITCSSNDECGTDGYLGDAFCLSGDLYKTYREYTCVSPGTVDSSCTFSDTTPMIQDCTAGCEAGTCLAGGIICSQDSDCGAYGYIGDNYCIGDDVYRLLKEYTCNLPGTPSSYCTSDTQPILIEECDETCVEGDCDSGELEVIFRTNLLQGLYWGCTFSDNCWIAIDFDGDGELDAMGYDGKSTSQYRCNRMPIVGYTPEGFKIIDYGSANRLAVCDDHGETRFSTIREVIGSETSSLPTEPYTTNGQEVYG